MHYLSNRHEQLTALSKNALLRWFEGMSATGRNALLLTTLAVGVLGGAGALTGRASPVQYFCIHLPKELRCHDGKGKPLRMALWHWQNWARDGRPREIVPHPTLGVEPPSNSYKLLFALLSTGGFISAGAMLRLQQQEAGELAVLDDISKRRDAALVDVAARRDVLRSFRDVAIAQAEIEAEVDTILTQNEANLRVVSTLGDAEVQIARLDAEDAVWEAQTAGLDDERRREFLEYAKSITTPFRPQLSGDTLDEITDPSDKVGGTSDEALQPSQVEALMSQGIPEEDIAQAIANADALQHMNVAIAGDTGSGKTSVTVNALKAKHDALQGNIDIQIFNGKPEADNNWGGFKGSPMDYLAVNSPDRALEMLEKFRALRGVLTKWQDGHQPKHAPMLCLFDEVNNQRLFMPKVKIPVEGDGLMSHLRGSQWALEVFDETMKLFVTQCRSEKSGVWIMTHSYLVDNIGLDRQLQRSFSYVVLGLLSYDLISSAINDADLITSKATRDRLREQFEIVVPTLPKRTPLALTNVGGRWRLVRLPRYKKSVYIARGTLNQSAAEIADESLKERLDRLADESPKLTEKQQAILDFGRSKQDWIKPSDVQAEVWGFRSVRAADIIKDFQALEAMRYGKSEDTGRTTKWRILP